ncbi:MAG: hypothetical protein HFG02_05230, partial [Oscillibacter sp.]|nr:hypothetical protein [Oscillibacter sp.]
AYSAGGTTILRLIAVGTDEATMGKLNDALAKPEGAEYTDFEEVKDPDTPVEPSETIKAELDAAGTTVTGFYSYQGDALEATPLTEAEVTAAIAAASGHKVVSINMETGKATLDNDVVVSFATTSATGTYKSPNKLFKVTVTGVGDQYVKNGGKLTGLSQKTIPALLPEKTVASSTVVAISEAGESAVLTLNKDVTYVPAVKYTAAPANLTVYAKSTDADNTSPVSLTVNTSYVQKGATLLIVNKGTANKSVAFTLEINGVKSSESFDDKGVYNKEKTFTNEGKYATTLEISDTAGYDIYLNGKLVKSGVKADVNDDIGVSQGATLVVAKTVAGKEVLSLPTGTSSEIGGHIYYTVDAADAENGKINLWEAYSFTASATSKYVAAPELEDGGLKGSVGTYVKAGEKIYLAAATNTAGTDVSKLLKVAEASADDLTLVPVTKPSAEKVGIWELAVNANISDACFDLINLSTVFGTLAESLFGAAKDNEIEKVVTLSATGITADDTATAEVYPANSNFVVKKVVCSEDQIDVTIGFTAIPTGAFNLIVDVNGAVSFNATITYTAPTHTLTVPAPSGFAAAASSTLPSSDDTAEGAVVTIELEQSTAADLVWADKVITTTPAEIPGNGSIVFTPGANGVAVAVPTAKAGDLNGNDGTAKLNELKAVTVADDKELYYSADGSSWTKYEEGTTADADVASATMYGFGDKAVKATLTIEVTMGTADINITGIAIDPKA